MSRTGSKKTVDTRAAEAEERRLAAARSLRNRRLAIGAGVAVLLVGAIVFFATRPPPAALAGRRNLPRPGPSASRAPAIPPRSTTRTRPTSGPHAPSAAACGIYREAPPDINLVHDLEHGVIVVYYNPETAVRCPRRSRELRPRRRQPCDRHPAGRHGESDHPHCLDPSPASRWLRPVGASMSSTGSSPSEALKPGSPVRSRSTSRRADLASPALTCQGTMVVSVPGSTSPVGSSTVTSVHGSPAPLWLKNQTAAAMAMTSTTTAISIPRLPPPSLVTTTRGCYHRSRNLRCRTCAAIPRLAPVPTYQSCR